MLTGPAEIAVKMLAILRRLASCLLGAPGPDELLVTERGKDLAAFLSAVAQHMAAPDRQTTCAKA